MKKALSLLLTLILLLALLTGCGNVGQPAESAPEPFTPASNPSETPSESSAPEEENGVRLPAKMTVLDIAYEVTYDGDTMTITGEDGTKIVTECTPDGTHLKATAYDAEGNVTESMEYLYEFDADGSVKKETSHNSNGVSLIREYDGKRLLREERYHKGELACTDVYIYDEAERRTLHRFLASDGSQINEFVTVYDEQGRETQYITYNSEGGEMSRGDYFYDENGNRTEALSYIDSFLCERRVYTYDANGNKTSVLRYDGSGDLTDHVEWAFDEYNNMTKEVHYNRSGEVSETWEYVYQYDAEGNKLETVCYYETVTMPRYVYYRRSFSYDGVNALGQSGMIEIVTEYAAYESDYEPANHPAYVREYILDGDGDYAGRWKDVQQNDDGSAKTYFAITETCTAPLTDAQYAAFEKVFLRVSANTETFFASLDMMK